jgi:L,D-peptidoglycan transpeptidase YkuD (ErfK/YbiS/YcfS/YnhG family)
MSDPYFIGSLTTLNNRSPKLKVLTIFKQSLVLITGLTIILCGCQKPPAQSLEIAKASLDKAAKSGAIRYAEKKYREAENLMKTGWMEMARQNGRFAPLRQYQAADSILNLATKTAVQAGQDAVDFVQNLDSLTRREREELQRELIEWRDALDGSLTIFQAERHWTYAEMSLKAGDKLMALKEYADARAKIASGLRSLDELVTTMAEYADDNANKMGIWRRWVDETLEESRNRGCHAIIVDKAAHKTYFIDSGKLEKTFNCELGYNSARQKLFAGDGATPEGRYYVTETKYRSKYYRALMINFPNENDKRRFAQNKAKGIITKRAGIGNLIEIHGNGGRGYDWTNGCVAVTDGVMDQLMPHMPVGSPITIVRSSDRWP